MRWSGVAASQARSAPATAAGCSWLFSGVMTKSSAASTGIRTPIHFWGLSGPTAIPSPASLYGGPYPADSVVPASSPTVVA